MGMALIAVEKSKQSTLSVFNNNGRMLSLSARERKSMEFDYLQFSMHDQDRFQQLVKVFNRLKQDKAQNRIDDDERSYLPYFDQAALSFFWWPTDSEIEAWEKRWRATPNETRWTDPSLERPWMFGSMIHVIQDCEFELVSCRLITPDLARLEFQPLSDPYGGSGCLQALIEAFGFTVSESSDGA
jgi:hypothetical protein